MELIDIGANLTHESFSSDLRQVIEDAKNANISHIILTGTDLKTSLAAKELSAASPSMHSSTAGFHPHVASTFDDAAFAEIARLSASTCVVAIGETGLDYNRNFSSKSDQLTAFERHLELASDVHKPVFLHQREAHEDFYRLLAQYRGKLTGGVVHCFTDNEAALKDYLALDMYIGVTGWICDERRGLDLQRITPMIPLNRLLIETDAPYLMPRNLNPKPKNRRNEPKYLISVLEKIAECYQVSPEVIAQATTTNAKILFNIDL
jgi:TatD DNase family protein|tara:strand:- start:1652 stop:2443 length:792 start_codon:yes stop_codon:yes gene_type:complete